MSSRFIAFNLTMASYFGKQEGDFSVVLRSICARKTPAKEEETLYTKAVGRLQGSIPQNADTTNEQPGMERRTGWLGLFSGFCTVS